MGWLEAKHRRSEEKAERLQLEELEKIRACRVSAFDRVAKLNYDKYGVSSEQLEFLHVYLSEDTDCSDYGTDTYRLAKETRLYGRVIKFDTISPAFVHKHSLYDNLARTPASHRFPTAIDYSPLLNEMIRYRKRYQYKACYMLSSDVTNVVLKHRDLSRIECRNMETMYDGLPATVNKEFNIITEQDFTDIRILFLLATDE